MKPVNQNTVAPDGQSVPKKVHTLTDAPNGGGTADGYVLVPAHPKPEMLGAFWSTKNTGTTEIGGEHQDSSDVAAYRAMIAAAPAPDPEPVARALDEVAATGSPAHADRCRRLAAVLRQPGFGEVRHG